jgi:catechol 2,3-dioxygenase-like lactoylglutathione lyase family enzyme
MLAPEVGAMTTYPTLRSVVLDCEDARALAEFYRELLGLTYRPGDEDATDADWLVLRGAGVALAFQQVDRLPASTWPDPAVPQQLHLDTTVSSLAELAEVHDRALALGARVLYDRTDDPDEPLWVFADPAGHPFCVFVVEP